jgi:hypothetical protein
LYTNFCQVKYTSKPAKSAAFLSICLVGPLCTQNMRQNSIFLAPLVLNPTPPVAAIPSSVATVYRSLTTLSI